MEAAARVALSVRFQNHLVVLVVAETVIMVFTDKELMA